jgi:hypothetical protein
MPDVLNARGIGLMLIFPLVVQAQAHQSIVAVVNAKESANAEAGISSSVSKRSFFRWPPSND